MDRRWFYMYVGDDNMTSDTPKPLTRQQKLSNKTTNRAEEKTY